MDRRSFLRGLFSTIGIAAVAPKLIFDMGANSRVYTAVINPAYVSATHEELYLFGAGRLTPEMIRDAFLAAPPLISEAILDLSITHPNWLQDLVRE